MANYVLIERIELNATAASVTFSNIPQTGYTDLKIEVSPSSTRANAWSLMTMTFNGTTTGYSSKYIEGGDGIVVSGNGPTSGLNMNNGGTTYPTTFGTTGIYIPNYNVSQYKSVSVETLTEGNSSSGIYQNMVAGLWSNTAAVTSVTFTTNSGSSSFTPNSTFSLYGIAAVGTTPAVAPKADGGNVIATDGTYWYHAFLSNGTFTPQVGLSADVLVVAGGGGGGGEVSGGGGAGGLLTFTSQALTATGYTCTVGSGGPGGTAGGGIGTVGVDSQFGALTLVKGGGGGGFRNANSGNGGNGGSGGGAAVYNTSATGGTQTSGQGYQGGNATGGSPTSYWATGGGGGAGAQGTDNVNLTPIGKNGGVGLSTAISGGSTTGLGQNVSGTYYFAGGGGSGAFSSNTAGGSGGSGGGGSSLSTGGGAGTANTGGGGGGTGNPSTAAAGGAGGSGIIIIRYPVA